MTLLSRNILTDLIGHLLGVGFLNIMALIIRILFASCWIDSPNLLSSNNFPVILTVFFVEGDTLSLCVWLQHSLVLIPAHLVVNGVAHLVLHNVTLFSGSVLTQSLTLYMTLLLIYGFTFLVLFLVVFRVPNEGISNATLN